MTIAKEPTSSKSLSIRVAGLDLAKELLEYLESQEFCSSFTFWSFDVSSLNFNDSGAQYIKLTLKGKAESEIEVSFTLFYEELLLYSQNEEGKHLIAGRVKECFRKQLQVL